MGQHDRPEPQETDNETEEDGHSSQPLMVDALVFFIAAAVCLTGALGVILARNPVHSALMLVMTLFGIAVQFVAQEAHFLAAVQVIVYAGAIVVLFFVIMLLGVDRAQDLELSILPGQRWAALVFGAGSLMVLGALIVVVGEPVTGAKSVGGSASTAEKCAPSGEISVLRPCLCL